MTNLEQFLKKEVLKNNKTMEPASGSFQCQNNDCDEIVYEGYADKNNGRLHWTCSQGHESSVVI
jgi:hypothetical protein